MTHILFKEVMQIMWACFYESNIVNKLNSLLYHGAWIISQQITTETTIPVAKVGTNRHLYRAEQKEPTQFGSVSGSEIQHFLFP